MNNPIDEEAAFQVNIQFDTANCNLTSMNKTDRSETMDHFNYSDMNGGIRITMIGVGN